MRRVALKRGKALRPFSKKRRRLIPARRACIATVRERSGGRCEVIEHGQRCVERATEVHELLSRARGGSPYDPSNCKDVCGGHHSRIHNNPAWAMSVGLLVSQYRPSAGEGR